MQAPIPPQHPTTHTLHGRTWTDEFAWLKAQNWQDVLHNPAALPAEIRAYLEAENAHSASFFEPLQSLQDELFTDLKSRVPEADSSVPVPCGAFEYFTAFTPGAEYPRLVRTPRGGGAAEVVADGQALAAGQPYFSLDGYAPSPCGRYVVYGTDTTGAEFSTQYVWDSTTGKLLPDAVPSTEGTPVWRADSAAFYFIKLDANHRPAGVWCHVLGTPHSADTLVFAEADKGLFMSLASTCGGTWAVADVHDHTTSEAWLLDLTTPNPTPLLVAPRTPGVLYEAAVHPTLGVVVKTNRGAEDFTMLHAPLTACGAGFWAHTHTLIEHVPGRPIEDWELLANWLVAEVWQAANPTLLVLNLATREQKTLAFDAPAFDVSLKPGLEFAVATVRYTFSTLAQPVQTFDYQLATGEHVLRKTQSIPCGHNAVDYVVERRWVPAPAGPGSAGTVHVPVSILRHTNTPVDGTAPLWLNGYGAYGLNYPAGFDGKLLSLVNRGWVFARAHIRGGAECGRGWYLNGKLSQKVNSFSDFIAVAEALVEHNYTARGRIVANGASAGGLLMGAVANRAPAGLLGGIVAGVPFVDALNTMLDAELPLTPPEWPEWGNPAASAEQFDQVAAYSPYENVHAGPYPAMFIHCGLTDPRVTYWEPAKWVARLRTRAHQGKYYLHTSMASGHFGSGARYEYLREYARNYAFALAVMGQGGGGIPAP